MKFDPMATGAKAKKRRADITEKMTNWHPVFIWNPFRMARIAPDDYRWLEFVYRRYAPRMYDFDEDGRPVSYYADLPEYMSAEDYEKMMKETRNE